MPAVSSFLMSPVNSHVTAAITTTTPIVIADFWTVLSIVIRAWRVGSNLAVSVGAPVPQVDGSDAP